MGTFIESGKDTAAKEEDGVRLSSAVLKIQRASNPPLPLRLSGYGKPLGFCINNKNDWHTARKHCRMVLSLIMLLKLINYPAMTRMVLVE